MPAGFQIGPAHGDGVGLVLGGVLQFQIQGRFAQEARNEQAALPATDSPHLMPLLLFKKVRPDANGVLLSRHVSTAPAKNRRPVAVTPRA